MSDGSSANPGSAGRRGGRRPKGVVRSGLVEAGIDLARAAGPDAVTLREATRIVGVAPNAAYRHFADRDALLNAVCVAAMRLLVERMEYEMALVPARKGTKSGATARLSAVGTAYLGFAASEPGLFDTVFAVPGHIRFSAGHPDDAAAGRTPLLVLSEVLDELVAAGVFPARRRPNAEFTVWSCVHGMAMLRNHGPLRDMPAAASQALADALRAFVLRGI
ncbi:MAG TPA: TetR/AcrR family transcriptional regulator [Trebonia sp.]